MQDQNERPQIDLILIGGGHAHVSVLRSFGIKPIPGLRITLISDVLDAPYSGMLPGFVEKSWQFNDMHIHLPSLCQFASARLIHAQVEDIDLSKQQISIRNHAPMTYDFLSLNSGAVPDLSSIPGADEHAITVKPISHFLEQLPTDLSGKTQFSVIGGGAAGSELALALRKRYQDRGSALSIQLFSRADRLVPQAPRRVSKVIEKACERQHITIHHEADVTSIKKAAVTTSTASYASDFHFIVTGVKPAKWVHRLSCSQDESGFILTRKTLQLKEYDNVFAAGDIAQIEGESRPKAGVFAVRAGPILAKNIRNLLEGQSLFHYHPQTHYLAIIGLSNAEAIAYRGSLAFKGKWVWLLKKWIDKKFMDKFNILPQMKQPVPHYPKTIQHMRPKTAENIIYCSGCGSKAGPAILKTALQDACDIAKTLGANPKYLPTLNELSDTAPLIWDKPLSASQQLIQSIDTISQHISDPFIFGRVAALHAMSDIFVSGGKMHSASAHITLLRGSEEIQQRDLTSKLAGAMLECAAHGAKLIGGHTIASEEAAMGLAVTGITQKARKKQPMPAEDLALILTKPLGIGVILAGTMKSAVPSNALAATYQTMLQSNFHAAQTLIGYGSVAMTDVTGFGLAPHLLQLIERFPGLSVSVQLEQLPFLPHAVELSCAGIQSSLFRQNRSAIQTASAYERKKESQLKCKEEVCFDPQTSGGVLALLPQSSAKAAISALQEAGYMHAKIIGYQTTAQPRITFTA